MGTKLTFDAIRIGHKRCNSYGMALVTNKRCYDLLDDKALIRRLMQASSKLVLDRKSKRRTLYNILSGLIADPALLLGTAKWMLAKLQTLGPDLLAARGRANKLSVFIHNFMDSCELDQERLKACTLMMATSSGPVSMCRHNARRDDFPFEPVRSQGITHPERRRPASGTSSLVNCIPGGPMSNRRFPILKSPKVGPKSE